MAKLIFAVFACLLLCVPPTHGQELKGASDCPKPRVTVNGRPTFLRDVESMGALAVVLPTGQIQVFDSDCHTLKQTQSVKFLINNNIGEVGTHFVAVQVVRQQRLPQNSLPTFSRSGTSWERNRKQAKEVLVPVPIKNVTISDFQKLHSAEQFNDASLRFLDGTSWHAELKGSQISTYTDFKHWQLERIEEIETDRKFLLSNRVFQFEAGVGGSVAGVPFVVGTNGTERMTVKIFSSAGESINRVLEIRFSVR